VDCAVLTVSDTRRPENDESGLLIADLLSSNGHFVVQREILPDDPDRIQARVVDWCESKTCGAVLLTGGTGLAPRDSTYEAIAGLLEKRLDGFGELFRMLSYEEIGAAAMLSRAVAGSRGPVFIAALPGSPAAVRLALEKLILPQLPHIAALLTAT